MNTQSGKQEGLSNTDTKHSTNIADDPDKSTKGEGTYVSKMIPICIEIQSSDILLGNISPLTYLIRRSNANTELRVKAAQRQPRTKEQWILKDHKPKNFDGTSWKRSRAVFADQPFSRLRTEKQ